MEGFPGGPVVVRVTYIDDLPPWIEMWHQTDDDPPRYPYIDIMRPSAPTDEEWLEMLGRARYYTFVRSEANVLIGHPHQRFRIPPTWPNRWKATREEGILTLPKNDQNYIDHVAYVVDESSSMQERTEDTIRVIDNQTQFLAELSKQTGRETRVSIYIFSDPEKVRCVVYEKDVLRLPSIRQFYKPDGWTALVDATALAIEDLQMTPVKYGDHAFLLFAFTDGMENQSRRHSAQSLNQMISRLGVNWTVAALVPDVNGKLMARRLGFPDGNISIWNVNSKTGVDEAGETMKAALTGYSVMRTSGQSGTRTLFATDPTAVNAATIQAAGLRPLDTDAYTLVPVPRPRRDRGQGVENKDKHLVWEISDFVKHATGNFTVGSVLYQLSKKEKIQGNKKLAVLENSTGRVFHGDAVRAMIGLPDADKTVAPDFNPEYTIFVQSTSVNRHLVVGTKVLVLK